MELSPEEYDPETGLPLDKGYLECDLPPYVQEAIDQMQKTWARIRCRRKIHGLGLGLVQLAKQYQ